MTKRALWALVSALVVLALVVAACAGPTPSTTPPSSPTPTTPSTTTAPPKTTAPATTTAPPTTTTPASMPKSYKFRLAGLMPKGTQSTIPAEFIEREITKRTNGRISFTSFYAGTMVSAGEEVDALQRGTIDITVAMWIFNPGRVPLGQFPFYFLFNNPDIKAEARIMKAMYDTVPALNAELAQFNIAPPLVFMPVTPYNIISKMPIKTLADLNGRRVGHTATAYVPAISAVGAASVISPSAQAYERLERGVIDAFFVPTETMGRDKLGEVAKYHTTVGFNTPGAPISVWMNMDKWKALSPEDQKLFRDVGWEASLFSCDEDLKLLEKAMATFKDQGVTFYTMPQEEVQKWAGMIPELLQNWINDIESKGKPGKQIAEAYIKLSEQEGWVTPPAWKIK